MMIMTCPKITIKKNIDNKFLIQTKGSEPASGMIFKLGEEFQEFVKDVSLTVKKAGKMVFESVLYVYQLICVLQNVAVLDEEGSLIIKSTYGGVTATRKYEVENDDEMILVSFVLEVIKIIKRC